MTQLRVIKTILSRRGYLVLWQARWHEKFTVGELVPVAGGEGFNLGKPLQVIRATSERDFLTQQQLSRRIDRAHWKDYSATAHLLEIPTKGCREIRLREQESVI